jgi:hypothetical protein
MINPHVLCRYISEYVLIGKTISPPKKPAEGQIVPQIVVGRVSSEQAEDIGGQSQAND